LLSDSRGTQRILTTGRFEAKSLHEIKSFIENNVRVFKEKYNSTDVEKGLNQQFVLCMNSQIRDEKFFFHHEYLEDITRGNSPQVDIAVVPRESQKASFVLEAKRLNASLPSKRKKEYLFRDGGGGVERFKKEIHGQQLTYVGMIGYVQTDDFDIWLERINRWIDEEIQNPSSDGLVWEEKDKLLSDKSNELFATYNSEHTCMTKNINMYHIWIDLQESEPVCK